MNIFPLLEKYKITSLFGVREPIKTPEGTSSSNHKGVDIVGTEGQALGDLVISLMGGQVIAAGDYMDGYGNKVIIATEGGIKTHYAHLSEIDVKAGQSIIAGQVVGKVGSTGKSTAPHLHFGISQNDTYIDPLQYLLQAQQITTPTVNYGSSKNGNPISPIPRIEGYVGKIQFPSLSNESVAWTLVLVAALVMLKGVSSVFVKEG